MRVSSVGSKKITFLTGLCLWIMPRCCVSKCPGFSNGFCPCRAVGKWSMEEHLWYLFVAGVTAGCSCRGEAGPLSPTASPCRLSEWVARLVRLPEYFTVALQVLPKGHLPRLCHVFQLSCKTWFGPVLGIFECFLLFVNITKQLFCWVSGAKKPLAVIPSQLQPA